MPIKIASVILDTAVNSSLDYSIPDELHEKVNVGSRVTVPVRNTTSAATVIEIKSTSEFAKLKAILSIIGDQEALTPELFKLAQWMAEYYASPLRVVLRILLPASVRRDAGHKEQWFVTREKTREELIELIPKLRAKASAQADVIEIMLKAKKGMLLTELLEASKASRSSVNALVEKGLLLLQKLRIDRSPLEGEEYFITSPKALNTEQSDAYKQICQSIQQNQFQTHLLYGITGSGKTEVYLQSIDKALSEGKSALMMVPEIALTAQTIERFRCRFKNKIAILHHRLSDGERYDAWHSMRTGDAKIVIGARSAIFSPLDKLGLIIVDEEHENSYKQSEQMPCYNARDVAVMRGKICNATVVLGSATPSLESYHNAVKGKYQLSILSKRPDDARLPKINIVDMRKEYEKAQGVTTFSSSLLDGISKRIQQGEQTILFLNRRGYHTLLLCKGCGVSVKCSHCDTSMTFHLGENSLSCHLCGFTHSPPPRSCLSCKQDSTMKFRGIGTEHVERALHAIFPTVRTIRMDADTTRHKGSHQRLLRDFGTGKADVLIGTQMIAKGLHFPEVTLVGVLNCDTGLNIPDFRAAEQTFQLLSQVAGRAGRGVVDGEVIIQTSLPENSTIQYASTHDFKSFFNDELASREAFNYPPFSQLAKIILCGDNDQQVLEQAEKVRLAIIKQLPTSFEVLPVVPSGHAKIKDKFRFQFLVRGPSIYQITKAYHTASAIVKKISISIDINPYSTYF